MDQLTSIAAPATARRPERAIGLGAMEAIFGVHIGLANAAIVQDFKRSLDHLQLTPKQTALMWLAEEHPGLAQVDAARVLRVDRATMLGITNAVVRRGLIERGAAEGGRRQGRRIGLHLTARGRAMLAEAKVAIAAHERRIKAGLSAREIATVTAVLKRIYA